MSAQPDRRVRLTFPSSDEGWACILADGALVGYVRRGTNGGWKARLLSHAGDRNGGYADAPVTRPRLGEVREALRERVREKGEWWTAGLCEVLGYEVRSDEEAGGDDPDMQA